MLMAHNVQPIVAKKQQLIRSPLSDRLQPMVATSKSGFSERLTRALEEANIPIRKRKGTLARWCNVSRESARKWLAGESLPETKRIEELATYLGVNGEWLLTARGPIREQQGVNEPKATYGTNLARTESFGLFIDAEILMNILDEIGRWNDPPDNNRELADIIATGYGRIMLAIRDEGRSRIKAAISQTVEDERQRHGGKDVGGKSESEADHG